MNIEQAEVVGAKREEHGEQTPISVNFKPVIMPNRQATGLEIKQTAIRQGVNIQIDFVLFRDKGHGRRDPIRDDERVELHPGEKFEAVPGDDNS
jgi:Multiubiquitin